MVTIDGYVIDAAPTEEHEFPNEVTEHPVEEGANVADHVIILPDVVTIEGVVSDTPIAPTSLQRTPNALPSDQALVLLKGLRDSRRLTTIQTSLRVFQDVVLENLNVPRDARTGEALRFTATFRQVRLVTNQRTTIRTAVPRGRAKVNRGNKPSEPTGIPPQGIAPPPAKYTNEVAARLFSTGILGTVIE